MFEYLGVLISVALCIAWLLSTMSYVALTSIERVVTH
jgi:hypothetical protein